jgi:ABC-2 type transport system ATP-binding protein
VEVALEPDGQAHGEGLGTLGGVTKTVKMGDKWRLYTVAPSALLPEVVDYARAHDLELVSLCTLGPSLEDVFLKITGQEIGTVRHDVEGLAGRGRKGGRR